MSSKLGRLGGCLAACALAACSNGTQVVGSKFVKTATVSAAGATIVVSNSDDSTLAGTTLTIPANALSQTTTISIGLSSQAVASSVSGGATAEGPVVDFEPSGTVFNVPVTVAIPVTATTGLFIEAVEADGSTKQLTPQSVANGIATFQISGFTLYGGCEGGNARCSTDADCATGQECVNAVCVTPANTCDGGLNPGDICTTDADCTCLGLACVSGHCGTPPANDGGVVDGGSMSCSTDSDCPECGECVDGECFASDQLCAPDGGIPTSDGGCGVDTVVCSGTSTDLNSDPANCGACGDRCASGVCSCGACAETSCGTGADCPANETCINGACTMGSGCSADSDCPSGEVCANGECSSQATDGGTLACGTDADCGVCAECVSGVCLFSDQLCAPDAGVTDAGINPGGTCSTDADCFSGEVCISGVCTTETSDGGCASEPAVCNGVRTDLSDDDNNCGACGAVCATGMTCACGACGL